MANATQIWRNPVKVGRTQPNLGRPASPSPHQTWSKPAQPRPKSSPFRPDWAKPRQVWATFGLSLSNSCRTRPTCTTFCRHRPDLGQVWPFVPRNRPECGGRVGAAFSQKGPISTSAAPTIGVTIRSPGDSSSGIAVRRIVMPHGTGRCQRSLARFRKDVGRPRRRIDNHLSSVLSVASPTPGKSGRARPSHGRGAVSKRHRARSDISKVGPKSAQLDQFLTRNGRNRRPASEHYSKLGSGE